MPKLSWLKGRVMARLLLLLIPFTIVSCKEDLVQDDKLSNKDNVMVVQAPYDHYNPYVNIKSNDYNVSNRYFSCTFNEKTTYSNVYAKQDGQIVDCGQCSATLDSDRKKLTVKYNEKGLINTTKEHTVYFSLRALTIKDNVPYVKSELNRTGSFYTVGKASLKTSGATVQGRVNGVEERAYIVNKTNSPIKFKHKGFSANELWYYSSAEISLDNMQTVVNGEAVKSDVESETIEVPLLSDNKWAYVNSHYPPNGKKIKNATLIAEIDGKEVRTSNTLSSDLDIVSGNAYLYVVEWDGKELRFVEDSFGEIHDCSDPAKSGMEILSINENNEITLIAQEGKEPKVGDIICSGATEVAPFGYAIKVESIEKSMQPAPTTRGWMDDVNAYLYSIKAGAIALEELIRYFGEDYHRWHYIFDKDLKIKHIINSEGNEIEFDEDECSIDVKHTFKLTDGISITPKLKLDFENFGIYFETKDFELKKLGYDFKFNSDISVDVDLHSATQYKKVIDVWHVILDPVTIPIGEVPLVITPLLQLYLTLEMDGHLSLQVTPVKVYSENRTAAYLDIEKALITPIEALNGQYMTFKNVSYLPEMDLDYTVSIGGGVELTPGFQVSLGLYGSNLIKNVKIWKWGFDANLLSVDAFIEYKNKIEGSIAYKPFSGNFKNDYTWGDEFNDECKLTNEVNVHVQPYIKLWKTFDKDFVLGTWHPFFENPSAVKSLLFPSVNEIKYSMLENYLNIKANKAQSLFMGFGYELKEYGFALKKDGEGNDKYKHYNIYNQYGPSYEKLVSHDISCNIPKTDLVAGNTYILTPYFLVKIAGKESYIYRPEKKFKYNFNGTLTPVTIDNVPGENL